MTDIRDIEQFFLVQSNRRFGRNSYTLRDKEDPSPQETDISHSKRTETSKVQCSSIHNGNYNL